MIGLIKACEFDHLSIVVRNITGDMYPLFETNIDKIASRLAERYGVKKSRVLWGTEKYPCNIRLPLFSEYVPGNRNPETPHLYIQLSPYRLRMEFKGHPLSLKHYLCGRVWLSLILGEYESDLLTPDNMKTTSTDVAIDISKPIETIAIDHRRSQISGTFHGRTGKLQTQYIGAPRSSRKWIFYDRCAKQKAYNLPVSEEPVTRIELRTKTDTTIDTLTNALKFEECFTALHIYDLEALSKSEILPQHLTGLIANIGLKPILQSMNDADRRRLRKQLTPFRRHVISVDQVKVSVEKSMKNVSYLYRRSRLSKWRLKNIKKKFVEVYGFYSI